MAIRYKTLRGTHDLLPDDCSRWQRLEAIVRDMFGRYGFREIRTPIIESTDLFIRSVGDTTDIVRKEMYTFERSRESITLRPENTASVARAVGQHSMHREIASGYPLRLYYMGPMFRCERPQAGRQRQFHQIGAEILGSPEPAADAETLAMLERFLDATGVSERRLLLNSLGDPGEREQYRDRLREWAAERVDRSNPEVERLLHENPLRLLDQKDEQLRAIMQEAPKILETLGADSRAHFDQVCAGLEKLGIEYTLDSRLVRGLDYYQRTVFEVVSTGLGAQNAILGGGRYDGLMGSLGGPDVPGFGFAIGMERLISLMPETDETPDAPDVALVTLGDAGFAASQPVAQALRDRGLNVAVPLVSRPLGAQLKRASRLGARFACFVDGDVSGQELELKDLSSGEQSQLSFETIVERVLQTKKRTS